MGLTQSRPLTDKQLNILYFVHTKAGGYCLQLHRPGSRQAAT